MDQEEHSAYLAIKKRQIKLHLTSPHPRRRDSKEKEQMLERMGSLLHSMSWNVNSSTTETV